MSDGIIVLMLVLAVICVMLATQPAPPPRSRRPRLPDQVKRSQPATDADGGNTAPPDDDDHRFSALHATAETVTPARFPEGQDQVSRARSNESAAASAFAIWPSNGNALR